jgi:hypothetical protein
MRTVSRILIILGLLALITIACSYLYLRSNYIIEPLVNLIKEQTGYSVTIENVSYNPIYPDKILLKHVKVNNEIEADQIFVEFDSKKIINQELYIHDIEIINARVNMDLLPAPSGKADLFKNITIKDLHLKDFSIKSKDWGIDDSIIELSNLDIVRNGRINTPKNFFVNMFANRIKFNDLILHSFNTTFHYTEEKITFDEFRANFKDGTVNSQLEINPQSHAITVKKLELNKIATTTDFESIQSFSGWKFDIYDAQLNDCSIELQDLMLSVRNLNLIVNDLSVKDNQLKHISVLGQFRQLNYKELQMDNASVAISQPLSNPISHILLSTGYSSGNIETYIKYNQETGILDVHELTMKDLRLVDTDFSEEVQLLNLVPFSQINFRVVNIQDLYYDSMNEYNPILIKNAALFMNHVIYRNGKIRSANRRSRIDVTADELNLTNFEITNLITNFVLDTQGQITVDSSIATVNKGSVSVSGMLNTVNNEFEIDLTGDDVGFDYLNTWLEGHQTVGHSNFEIKIKRKQQGDDEGSYEYNGTMQLKDVFISNFDIEGMKDSEGSNLKTNWIQSLSSGKSLMAQSAEIRFKHENKVNKIEGTIDAISKLYNFSAQFHEKPTSGDTFKIEWREKLQKSE